MGFASIVINPILLPILDNVDSLRCGNQVGLELIQLVSHNLDVDISGNT